MYRFLQARAILILINFIASASYSATTSFSNQSSFNSISNQERGAFIESICLINNKKLSECIKNDLIGVTIIFTQQEIVDFITKAAINNDEELLSRESIARAYREVYLAKISSLLETQRSSQPARFIKNLALVSLYSAVAVGGAYYFYRYYPELITGKKNTQQAQQANWWYTYCLQKPYNGIKAVVVTFPRYLCGY